jgi:hypothetical protein
MSKLAVLQITSRVAPTRIPRKMRPPERGGVIDDYQGRKLSAFFGSGSAFD